MAERRVRVARRETFPGEYSNIEIDVEVEVRPEETTQEALERASQEVASRLQFEKKRRTRRGSFWADREIVYPLEAFEAEEGPA